MHGVNKRVGVKGSHYLSYTFSRSAATWELIKAPQFHPSVGSFVTFIPHIGEFYAGLHV